MCKFCDPSTASETAFDSDGALRHYSDIAFEEIGKNRFYSIDTDEELIQCVDNGMFCCLSLSPVEAEPETLASPYTAATTPRWLDTLRSVADILENPAFQVAAASALVYLNAPVVTDTDRKIYQIWKPLKISPLQWGARQVTKIFG